MPCPFPGMDPYLELQHWSDFSPKFLTELSNQLLRTVLPKYEVRLEEYVMVSQDDETLHAVRPDVAVITTDAWTSSGTGTAVAVEEDTAVELAYPDLEPEMQRHLKLVHRSSGQVVTVIELLSPSNKKAGEKGLDAYLNKRTEFLYSHCNIVELDLLRGGRRLPMVGRLPRGDYFAFVGRVGRKPMCHVQGWSWRAPLPTISIPLLPEDAEVPLNLQEIFRATYDASLYDRRLPYKLPLVPPLSPADTAWTTELLQSIAIHIPRT